MSETSSLDRKHTVSGAHLELPDAPEGVTDVSSVRGWRAVPLKWRIAALTAVLLAIFATVLSVTVVTVSTNTLENEQRKLLEQDTTRAATFFANTENGTLGLESRPLGSSRITLFTTQGESLGGPPLALPDEVKRAAVTNQQSFSDDNGGRPIKVLLTPIRVRLGKLQPSPAVLAVWTQTTYIRELTATLRSLVLGVTLILILAALAAGYAVASISLRPLMSVARQATRLDEHHLEPLAYSGPRDELGLLTTTLNQMVQRLRRAFDAQKTFLAETSHELRTPLTALQGYLRIAAREANATQKPVLDDAQRVTDNMTRLVGDLLQLSRGEVVQEWVPHLVDLGELVRGVARDFRVTEMKVGHALELIGDPDRLTQLVRNLVSNAVRHAGKPEGVQIDVWRDGDHLELHVRDNGPGIPAHVLPRMFDKFYKGPGGGAGLGLAIAAQIVRVHQGQIDARNNPDSGAHFTVRLPALPDEE
jgi:hypothetical protein